MITKRSQGIAVKGEEKLLRKMVPKFTRLRNEMAALVEEEDKATGHAFVVFNSELDRNRMYVLFNPPKKGKASYEQDEEEKAAGKKGHKKKPPVIDVRTCKGSLTNPGLALCPLTGPAFEPLLGQVASPSAKEAVESYKAPSFPKMVLNWMCGFEEIDHRLSVTSAPEPREINWAALELDDYHERKIVSRGRAVMVIIMVSGVRNESLKPSRRPGVLLPTSVLASRVPQGCLRPRGT